jgi:hypothetical protein
MDSFENMARKTGIEILEISDKNIKAKGMHMSKAIVSFDVNKTFIISYPDTGVFILFKGSDTLSTGDKYNSCIENGKTTREIVFQSRNAAAIFVLGKTGNTHSWK